MLLKLSEVFLCSVTHGVSSSEVNAEPSSPRAQQKDKDIRSGEGRVGRGGAKREKLKTCHTAAQ